MKPYSPLYSSYERQIAKRAALAVPRVKWFEDSIMII